MQRRRVCCDRHHLISIIIARLISVCVAAFRFCCVPGSHKSKLELPAHYRDLTAAEAIDAGHGRPLAPAGIPGVYAAAAPDGTVMALLQDAGAKTKSVVVIRPATL